MKQWRVGCIAVATLCTLSACATARAAPRESARHLAAAVVLSPALDAPPLALPNYDGTPVTPARLRGAVLLVTFTYTHCRTVCPLIVARLRALRQELGSTARNVQLIAVSSDPQGDTPEAVGQFLAA